MHQQMQTIFSLEMHSHLLSKNMKKTNFNLMKYCNFLSIKKAKNKTMILNKTIQKICHIFLAFLIRLCFSYPGIYDLIKEGSFLRPSFCLHLSFHSSPFYILIKRTINFIARVLKPCFILAFLNLEKYLKYFIFPIFFQFFFLSIVRFIST